MAISGLNKRTLDGHTLPSGLVSGFIDYDFERDNVPSSSIYVKESPTGNAASKLRAQRTGGFEGGKGMASVQKLQMQNHHKKKKEREPSDYSSSRGANGRILGNINFSTDGSIKEGGN